MIELPRLNADRTTAALSTPGAARKIMGDHFVELEVAARFLRTRLYPNTIRQFSHIPYTAEVLRQSASSQVLIPDLGITICELCLLARGNMLQRESGETTGNGLAASLQNWCEQYHAAHLTETCRWRLVPLKLVANSCNKSLARRVKQANKNCPEHDNHGGVLTPRILIYTATLLHLLQAGGQADQ